MLSPQEVKARSELASLTLVDVQSAEGYAHRHIPGAIHLDASETCDEVCGRLLKDKDAEIVVYGEFDELGKGSQVGEMLLAAGYTNVARLTGGMMGWMEAGFAVENGAVS